MTYAVEPRSMVIEEFSPLVGQWFAADCDPEPVKIKLLAADATRPNGLDIRPPFTLIFFTPPHIFLAEGGYVLRCGQFGPDLVHIANIMPPSNGEAGHYYQAVFN